jgi:ribosomal protein RSM22 (predicted rRNA methylase)
MGEDSWCHFTQRMQRIPVQTQSKQNTSINWEDEKFSYVVLTKVTNQPKSTKINQHALMMCGATLCC